MPYWPFSSVNADMDRCPVNPASSWTTPLPDGASPSGSAHSPAMLACTAPVSSRLGTWLQAYIRMFVITSAIDAAQ